MPDIPTLADITDELAGKPRRRRRALIGASVAVAGALLGVFAWNRARVPSAFRVPL